jgi:hypothetical protein
VIAPIKGAIFDVGSRTNARVRPEVEFVWAVLVQQQARDCLWVELLGCRRHVIICLSFVVLRLRRKLL